ncbi:MAG: hypothetical protein DHS20C20_21080 [Ardenticatenaceae bacterium]|nr:MAG: hypothetical protein DHS20C20_21080 [Ardenticatenaceae bacterium]
MKRLLILFLLLGSTAVFFVACSDNQAAEAVVPTEAASAAPTIPPTPTDLPEEAGIDTSDLTLIGQTGRPQLLNAYASW